MTQMVEHLPGVPEALGRQSQGVLGEEPRVPSLGLPSGKVGV
jgi:hypothetical protein